MTRLILDTEFTDLSKEGELISIALVEHPDRWYYAEVIDVWPERLNDLGEILVYSSGVKWIQENVLHHLRFNDEERGYFNDQNGRVEVKDTKANIALSMKSFLEAYDEVELVCDVGHFDMIHFISLFGNAIVDLPKQISPAYLDVNQILAEAQGISIKEAFQMPRGGNHNALEDAIVIYRLFQKLTQGVAS